MSELERQTYLYAGNRTIRKTSQMSRAWEEAKTGAKRLGKVGLVGGAIAGAILGGLLFGIPGIVGGLVGVALKLAFMGVIVGGVIGGVHGAVTDNPSPNKTDKHSVQLADTREARLEPQPSSESHVTIPTRTFQQSIEESRARGAASRSL